MKKIILICMFIMLFASLLFAAESATSTLQITGYKNIPDEGILRVYVYNTTSSSSSTTEVGKEIDILDGVDATSIDTSLQNYITNYKDVFSIKIQTNLNKKVKIEINVNPFTSQGTTSSVIPTSYEFSTSPGTYETDNDYYYNRRYYYFKYSASMSNDKSTVTVSDSSSTDTATITQSISGFRKSSYYSSNWSTHTIPSSYDTLYPNDTNATVDSMIYVTMKLNTELDNILTNVKYVAPVKITVTME